jgi:hypothetical protein
MWDQILHLVWCQSLNYICSCHPPFGSMSISVNYSCSRLFRGSAEVVTRMNWMCV